MVMTVMMVVMMMLLLLLLNNVIVLQLELMGAFKTISSIKRSRLMNDAFIIALVAAQVYRKG